MPPLVIIIRHAEKPLVGTAPMGVTSDGLPDPESLTPRGWQRAGALISLFVPHPSGAGPTLPTPTDLLASQVGLHSSSRRPRETLEPLSERLGLTIDDRFMKEELAQLVQAVVGIDGVVLISWEHHLIPSIANMLVGDTSSAPQMWPDDRFDVVWLVDLSVPGKPAGFRQVPELLLAGDRVNPI